MYRWKVLEVIQVNWLPAAGRRGPAGGKWWKALRRAGLSLLLAAAAACGAQPTPAPLAVLGSVVNHAALMGGASLTPAPAAQGASVEVWSTLTTAADSRARLDFPLGAVVEAGPLTSVTLFPLVDADGPVVVLNLAAGRLLAFAQDVPVMIKTEFGAVTLRGALAEVQIVQHETRLEAIGLVVRCVLGPCAFSGATSKQTLAAMQELRVTQADTLIEPGLAVAVSELSEADLPDLSGLNLGSVAAELVSATVPLAC